jgi:hypothetical protein
VHPELFELKALVAGRLDPYRRREIDDHLGSCADCSRHYVALMLGSASPKTAEAESRQVLAHSNAASVLSPVNGGSDSVSYGIDAPIAPAAPRAPQSRQPHNNLAALETVFTPPAREPASASLVDAITKLRSESEATTKLRASDVTVTTPVASVLAQPPVSPVTPPLVHNRVRFVPTPRAGIAHVRPNIDAGFAPMTPKAPTPSPTHAATIELSNAAATPRPAATPTELVVTFSSETSRLPTYRSPAAVAAVVPVADDTDYVSLAVPTLASVPADEFRLPSAASAFKGVSSRTMMMAAAAVVAIAVVVGGYKSFQSSVSRAAAAAAADAAKRVEATAAARTPQGAPAVAPPQVQTRIVYVREPAKKNEQTASSETAPTVGPSVPVTVALPDVNVQTGSNESAMQTNAMGSAASDLARSARATASRTAQPRP